MTRLPAFAALLAALIALPCQAENTLSGQGLSPPMPPVPQQPDQLEDQRIERDATVKALDEPQNALVAQCRQLLTKQSKYPGAVHILSMKIVGDSDAAFRGRISVPDASGHLQSHPYRCHISADKSTIDSVTVDTGAAR